MIHPRSVKAIRLNGKQVEESTLGNLSAYMTAYLFIVLAGLLLVSLDKADFSTSFTATLTCLNNVGPGLGLVGPTGNFGFFADGTKYVLSFLMLFGRLEIFPLLLTFCPVLYRNR
jgi:trk system potassium uptake protein TrkH